MTRDDIKTILGENASEEQITNLLNKFHSSNNEQKNKITELEEKVSKMSDYDNLKAKLDEIEQANMTEQQKIEADKKLTAENLKKAQIIYNTAKVKEILAGETVSEQVLKSLINEDETISIANATALKQTLTDYKDAISKQTRETLLTTDLKPSMSNVNPNEDIMTFEKFSKLSAEEQNKFAEEYPDEFEKL